MADRTVVADRSWEVSHSRVAAQKRTVAARPRVGAECSRELGHSRAATHNRTAAVHSRGVADRTVGVGHNRVEARKRTAVAHNRMVAARVRGVGHSPGRPISIRQWPITGRWQGHALGCSMIRKYARGEQHCRGSGRNAKLAHDILCSGSPVSSTLRAAGCSGAAIERFR